MPGPDVPLRAVDSEGLNCWFLDYNDSATAALKASLKTWICVFSKLIAFL